MLSKSIITGKHYWHGEEIIANEYQRILAIIENRPTAPEGYSYRLTHDLEWELYELPIEVAENEEIDIDNPQNTLNEIS